MINPSELNLASLCFVDFTQRDSLPPASAVYFAMDDEFNVLYIGKTYQLKSRWVFHHRLEYLEKLNCTRIAWVELPIEALIPTETEMISYYKPLLNGKVMTDPAQRSCVRVKSDLNAELSSIFQKFYGIDVSPESDFEDVIGYL